MKQDEIYTKLFEFSRPTFYKWKREKVPVMKLLQRYFSNEDLKEFLESGYVSKYESTDIENIDPRFMDQVFFNLKRTLYLLYGPSSGIFEKLAEIPDDALDGLTVGNARRKLSSILDIEGLSEWLSPWEAYILLMRHNDFVIAAEHIPSNVACSAKE